MLLNPDVLRETEDKVAACINAGDFKKAASIARLLSPGRMAAMLTSAGAGNAAECLKMMGRETAGRVIASMPPEFSITVLMDMPEKERMSMLNNVPPDNIGDILGGMSDEDRENIVPKLEKKIRAHAQKIEKYPRDSVGRMMSPYFLSAGGERTIAETLEAILSAPSIIDRRPYVYVLDKSNKPIGVVSTKDLLRVDKSRKLKDVMNADIVAVNVTDQADEAARIIQNRRLMILPVVGENGFIDGVLTFDDAMKILSGDALNLMSFPAGIQEESFFTPPSRAIKKRLPWMVVNVFLNMGAVAVITGFETTIATVAILAAFIPMITDMGGNVGIQSLSVAIRSIALGEAKLGNFKKLVSKEAVIGMVNGFSLGVLFGFIAFSLKGNPYLGLLAGVALGINVLIAGVIGGTLPFLIKALGRDPAMMTGPFLTTVTDITGVSIYLGLSTIFLSVIS